VSADEAAMQELLTWTEGRTGTPVIVVDDTVIRGFDRGRLSRLLGLGGRHVQEG
jgi:hypothetical protein